MKTKLPLIPPLPFPGYYSPARPPGARGNWPAYPIATETPLTPDELRQASRIIGAGLAGGLDGWRITAQLREALPRMKSGEIDPAWLWASVARRQGMR
jgi:hypothetical protein